jgi:prepilin-type processing-associated H-X9-DG protein
MSAKIMNPRPHTKRRRPRGFTLLELLVLLGMLGVLVSIFVPYVLSVREQANRATCASKLREVGTALTQYAEIASSTYPRVRHDIETDPNSWTAFTGPDEPNPFAEESGVKHNDVTAGLWLLVRLKLASPDMFVCPSGEARPDILTDGTGRPVELRLRGNFRSIGRLGYSYASPFSNAPGYRVDDTPPSEFARMADLNPGIGDGFDVTTVKYTDGPLVLARANSANHGGAGQNVLFADGHVSFHATPFCGYGQDNIYTSLSPVPLQGEQPPPTGSGVLSRSMGPSWAYDSVLVPARRLEVAPASSAITPKP